MKHRRHRFGACHYCICTVCTRFKCPWSHLPYRECSSCRDNEENRPRLDCDMFSHYLKTHRYRVKRLAKPLPEHYGTYVLKTRTDVFIGSYERLKPISDKLGGELKRLNLLDHDFELSGEVDK